MLGVGLLLAFCKSSHIYYLSTILTCSRSGSVVTPFLKCRALLFSVPWLKNYEMCMDDKKILIWNKLSLLKKTPCKSESTNSK